MPKPGLEQLRSHLLAPAYRPQTFEEICSAFAARSADQRELKKLIKRLRDRGELIRLRNKRYVLRPLSAHAPRPPIAHGGPARRHEPKARIAPQPEIRNVVGRIELGRGRWLLLPFGREIRSAVALAEPHPPELRAAGGKVAAAELDWERSKAGRPLARLREILGPADDEAIDSPIVIWRRDLPRSFPPAVLREADSVAPRPEPAEAALRTDLRRMPFVTIDGADARDHDDAVALGPDGSLWVAIADVGHFVRAGGALDLEAGARGNSFYFPDRVLPMLPERLSNDLASLRPEVDRVVVAVRLSLSREGALRGWEFREAILRSRARLTYEGVDRALATGRDDSVPADLLPMLRSMREVAEKCVSARRAEGGIDFDLSESRVVLDRHGEVAAMARRERTPAQRIIEEFMLLANRAAAHALEDTGLPVIYRVHDRPDVKKLQAFFDLLRAHGVTTRLRGTDRNPRSIDELLRTFDGEARGKVYASLALRSMCQASYSTENLGHYGLGFSHYAHFTSPIRRYADLVVHRLLKAMVHGRKPAVEALIPGAFQTLSNVAVHVSAQERIAQGAEREIVTIKGIRFLASRLGQTFRGAITGVLKGGFFVALDDHAVEGFVHVSRLPRLRWEFDERSLALKARDRRFRVGDPLTVRAVGADLETFRTDFALA